MTNRRASRIAAVIASVAALLIVAVAIIVWSEMRAIPKAVVRAPRIQRPQIVVTASPPALSGGRAMPMQANEPTDIQTSPRRNPSPAPTPNLTPVQISQAQQNTIYNYLANRFASGSPATVNVCDNLTRVPSSSVTDTASLARALGAVAQGQTTGDPFVESVLAPMAFIYSRPAVQRLVGEVQTAQQVGNPSYLNRPEFRSLLALANSELIANKADLQRIGQHSYHLFVISRAVAMNPNLANDPTTRDLCERVQSELRPGVQVDLQAEQAAVLQYLAYADLAPQQVGYDPSVPQDLIIENTNQQIVVRFPWMVRTLRTEIGTATPLRQATSAQP